ncbi:SGNH/GDSL hydrolase family protein [Candidatus Woesebacteria bacterium]|nr:SGNH/GDSL hydrolase family protein [Candidatus Woesebacteria bacterium]
MDKTYCIFGDSVTQAAYVKESWVDQLKPILETKYSDSSVNTFNLGIGGNTTIDIVNRFDNESSARLPTDIIFAVGVNDSSYLIADNSPITTEEQFKTNLLSLIEKASKFTENITFIGTVLGDDSILKPYPGSSKGKSYSAQRTQKYDNILKELAEKNGCRFIYLMDKLEHLDFQDGLHPNDQGHRKMFEVIKEYF